MSRSRSHVCTNQFGSRRSIAYGSTVRVVTARSSGFRYSISTSLSFSFARLSFPTRSCSPSATWRSGVPAGGEEVGEKRLQHAEALRGNRAGRPLGGEVRARVVGLRRRRRRRAVVSLAHRLRARDDETAERRRLERDRASVLAEDPARELLERRVLGDEHVALD